MRESFSLYELQRIVSAAVEQALPLPVWVSAEISELKVNSSGHCYLELVEREQSSGSGAVAKASARAVIWKNRVMQLFGAFEGGTGKRLAAGLKILVQVIVNFHPLYGLSLQIVDIDPAYTVGDLERQKQRTIEQLKKDGVWDMNHTTAIPKVIQRIAIVSSATAAGYRDFMQELNSSPYRVETTLFAAVMQGEESEQSVVAALTAIADCSEEFDAVAIIRGGGSTADLECFNSYLISLYVAQFPLPVLSGIGHDKDTSVVDMVAAVPLKTPTAVATWICERAAAFDGELEYAAMLLRECCKKVTTSASTLLEQYQRSIHDFAKGAILRQKERLASYALIAENFAPTRLLKLGFAVARAKSGVISSTTDVECGDKITIEVTDGILTAEVIDKNGKKD